MTRSKHVYLALALGLSVAAGPALAQSSRSDGAQTPPRSNDPAEWNRVLRERAQHEPGVTQELEPDAKQSATGGPSGGVPGREGN